MACKSSCSVTFLIKTLQCLSLPREKSPGHVVHKALDCRLWPHPERPSPCSPLVLTCSFLCSSFSHVLRSLPRLRAGPPGGVSLPLSASSSCPPSALPSSSAFLGVRLKSSLKRGSLDVLSPSSHSLCISSSVMFIVLAGGLLLQQPVIPGRQAVLVTAVFPAPSVVCHTGGA